MDQKPNIQQVEAAYLKICPVHLEDTVVSVGELVEERRRHVKVPVVASGAFVHDSGGRLLAVR